MKNRLVWSFCGVLVILLLLNTFSIYAQGAGKGLIWEDTRYSGVERLGTGMKFSSNEPVVSLKSYCPQPGSQGAFGSCVGWATGYGALSISIAKKNNITDQSEITAMAHSALYIFNQIKVAGCQEGSRISDALELLKTKGDCLKADFNPTDCSTQPGSAEHSKALPYRIKDYATLFGIDDMSETKISATINSIASGKPVVIGMNVPKSFDYLRAEKWDRNLGSNEINGGHAMVVVGYNDYTKMFEIMNSWGTNWGKDGFCQISYDDYASFVKYGYQFSIDERDDPENDPIILSGDFVFERFERWDEEQDRPIYNEVKPVLDDNLYTLDGTPTKVGDYYRLVAKNVRKDKYIYVFSIDPSNKVEILYPKDKSFKQTDGASLKELPRVPSSNVEIQIPGGTQAIQTDVAGTDYLCILYSDKVIDDIQDLVVDVQQSLSLDFWEKLENAFGDRLMPVDNIEYTDNLMSVKASSTSGYIAPIVLQVEVEE